VLLVLLLLSLKRREFEIVALWESGHHVSLSGERSLRKVGMIEGFLGGRTTSRIVRQQAIEEIDAVFGLPRKDVSQIVSFPAGVVRRRGWRGKREDEGKERRGKDL